jgi:hypothetical protein
MQGLATPPHAGASAQTVVLVTDRPNPNVALSDALHAVAEITVVGPEEDWSRRRLPPSSPTSRSGVRNR